MTEPKKAPTGLKAANSLYGEWGANGLGSAAKKGWADIVSGLKIGTEEAKGKTGVAFARVGAVGLGGSLAFDALTRSEVGEGEDREGRSSLLRLAEFIVGGGIAATGLIAGKAR